MLTFGVENINVPSSRALWLSDRGIEKTVRRTANSNNDIGFSSPQPKLNRLNTITESTLQRYI